MRRAHDIDIRKLKNVAKCISMRRATLIQGLDRSLTEEDRLLTKLQRRQPKRPRAGSRKRGPGAQPQAFFYPRGGTLKIFEVGRMSLLKKNPLNGDGRYFLKESVFKDEKSPRESYQSDFLHDA